MVTGASTADLALLLVDARKGVLEQTRRHALLASLLRVPAPRPLRQQNGPGRLRPGASTRRSATSSPPSPPSSRSPTSTSSRSRRSPATTWSSRSTNMPWFDGQPLLRHLEDVHIASDRNLVDNRFPVQYVIRPQSAEHHDYRGYAGSVVGGIFKPGDEVMVLPSRQDLDDRRDRHARRRRSTQAFPPMAVTMRLDDELDISRGDMICRPTNQPTRQPATSTRWSAGSTRPRSLRTGATYQLKHTTRWIARRGRGRCATGSTSTPCTATATPRRSRSTTSAGSRSAPPRRSSSTSTGSTATTGSFILVDPAHQPHGRGGDDHRRRRRRRSTDARAGRRREHHLPPEQPLARGALDGAGDDAARRSG